MIEELKQNIEMEIKMLRELLSYSQTVEFASDDEKILFEGSINSLKRRIKIINSSIPQMLKEISLSKKLPSDSEKVSNTGLERIKLKTAGPEIDIVLNKKDREKFFRELSIGEQLIKKLKKRERKEKEKFEEFKSSRGYLKFANKLFLKLAQEHVSKGKFKDLSVEVRKANLDILFESYIALTYLSVFLSFIFSFIVAAFILFFDFSFIWPFFSLHSGNYLLRIGKVIWIPLLAPVLTFLGFYIYPTTEKKSIGNKINQELPFAVIHMSAVSGSGIEPSEIFKIVALSKEYPALRKEIRKVLNQINLYGYDLVTALNTASKTAPSEKLAELFSGLSTTITSGADLQEFFEKRAETLLLNYRLEREKYTKVIEIFLDIYISVVIAAPMIFLLLLVMMLVSGINIGITTFQITLLVTVGISLLNIFFIFLLYLRQPSY
jgi:flagellar protein FlaJ